MTVARKLWIGRLCLGTSIVLSALGQLCMKIGMQALHSGPIGEATGSAIGAPAVLWTLIGLGFYAVSMLSWLAALVRYPLSYAYPLLGLSYVLVYIGAAWWPGLEEPVTMARTVGTLLIMAGVALVSRTERHIP